MTELAKLCPRNISQEMGKVSDVRTDNLDVRSRVADRLAAADEIIGQIDRLLGGAALVESLPQEKTAEMRFDSFLGETAVKQVLDKEAKIGSASNQTLAKSIPEAKEGNAEAMNRIDINVDTATSEGWFKRGHFRRIEKERSPTGEVVQFGLTTETMHRDSLVLRPDRPKKLKIFTLAEAMNGFREQELVRNNELQDSWFIVPSCVPEDLPEEQLDHRGDGFFTRSMTYSLQGTTQEGAKITTEIFFDQGTHASEYADYEERQNGRFDIAAIGKVYEKLGLPAPQTALEMLESPIKVPKHLMPNGMIDFWRWVDEAADELRGESIVRTEEEYLARIQESHEREKSIVDAKRKIKEELLNLDPDENNDIQAVEALWELVRKYGPEEAASNDHIDPIVFGPDAAEKIVEARRFMDKGEVETARLWVQLAMDVATVTGCGGGGCSVKGIDAFSKEGSMAEKAGLKGPLYESEEVNQNAKCNCPKTGRKAKVITDGSSVVCTTCGTYEVNGTKGNVKEAA